MVLGGAAIQRGDQANNRISPVPEDRETEDGKFFAPLLCACASGHP